MSKSGAKARMARLQGRRERECACGDTTGLSERATCGELLCRDCKIDHDCVGVDDDGRSDRRKGKS